MKLIELLYEQSPIWLQNLMISCSGYLRNRTRYRKAYKKHREFLKEFDLWSLEKKKEYQNSELQSFLQYAVENSPYYRRLYQGIDISTIRNTCDLGRLPILTKELLRENINEIITIPRRGAVEGHTGGTTGKSLVVLYTKEDMNRRMAVLDHFKERLGFKNRKMTRASFSGKHIVPPGQKKKVFWRYNRSCKQMLYSTFHLAEENLIYYVRSLNRFKPQALDGFCMPMCEIAAFIEQKKLKLTIQPLAIFTTAETVTSQNRALLERVFRCSVYDQYSSSEGAPFVTECKSHSYHIEMSTGIVETVGDLEHEVLVTSFTTHGTPLIRYRIGDLIPLKEDVVCDCGIASEQAAGILGRDTDFLYTAEGIKIYSANISNLFKNIPNAVRNAQMLQSKPDMILIRLVVDKSQYKPEYDKLLEEEFRHKFGENTGLKIEHVEEIAREESGKFRMIKNDTECVRL